MKRGTDKGRVVPLVHRGTRVGERLVKKDGWSEAGTSPANTRAWLRPLRKADRYGLLIALVIVLLVFSILMPGTFAQVTNFRDIASAGVVSLVLAVGLTLPLRAGDFDLSVGSNMAFCLVVFGELATVHHFNWLASVFVVAGVGAVVGVINGLLVVGLGLDGFIATLGTMTILGGLALGVTNSNIIVGMPSSLVNAVRGQALGIPYGVLVSWFAAAAIWYVYRYTPWGRNLLFVGGNKAAAKLSGIRVDRTRFAAFVLCGLLAGLAALLLAGQLGAADPTVGPEYLLPPYAAVFLGTAAVQVGRFNALGTVIVLYLVSVVVTGLELLGAPSWIAQVFNGVALIAAVAFAKFVSRSTVTR